MDGGNPREEKYKAKHSCDICKKQFKRKGCLNRHINSKHKGIKYSCNQCEYRATQKWILKNHILKMHTAIHVQLKHPCIFCSYQATTNGNLSKHVQLVHKIIKIPCVHCNHQTKTIFKLKKHIQNSHADIESPRQQVKATERKSQKKPVLSVLNCDLCDYKAPQQNALKNHIQSVHLKQCAVKLLNVNQKLKIRF